MQGLLKPRLTMPFANGSARYIVHAIGNRGPSVVASRTNDVDFVSALWPMLMRPELTGSGMQRLAFNIAIAP